MLGGYAHVTRVWQPGDQLMLQLAMPVERMSAHPHIRQNGGAMALQRGPLILLSGRGG
ncbi:MAG: glycoside hydrolase family 127 protein [Caldilineaceae bacterium]